MGPTVNTRAVKTVDIKNVTVKLENVLKGVIPDGETLHVKRVRIVARCINWVMKHIIMLFMPAICSKHRI